MKPPNAHMPAVSARPGELVVSQWRKWDGTPHWRHESVYVGADQWGTWLGQPVGWRSERPGKLVVAESPNVTLVPSADASFGGAAGAGLTDLDFVLTVNRGHPKGMRVYIDLGWDIRWEHSALVTGIDMDLDVVRVEGERGTWVDDRDEWAEHARLFGYPADVVARLERLALDLEERVREQRVPFDAATADRWLDRLEALALSG